MYIVSVILLLAVIPAGSIALEAWLSGGSLWMLLGKWYVFWASGVRLFMAGVMQTMRPQFTAQSIFGLKDTAAFGVVREVGFGNLSIGTLSIATLFRPDWLVPAAIVSGLYLGFAGLGHAVRGERNTKEQFAMWTDFLAFAVLAAFVVSQLVAR